MIFEKRFHEIIEKTQNFVAPTKDECIYLLNLKETSLETFTLMAVANALSRKRALNSGVILGQIGIDVSDCPGNCKFCVFGKEHVRFQSARLYRLSHRQLRTR